MGIRHHINTICKSISYRIGSCLIDSGDDWEGFQELSTVLLTHGHFDHIYGLNRVIELNPNVRIFTNESGREMILNAKKNLSFYHETPFVVSDESNIITISDGSEIKTETGAYAKAIFTPGHNPSCITWIIDNAIFTGDSYIPECKIVTNLPDGNKKDAYESIRLIKELSLGRVICPGHYIIS